jgi:uncharacterized metal-binding protein YceD (DUF177 family)
MGIKVNLRHLEDKDLAIKGQVTVAELDIDSRDELIRAEDPLDYDLNVQHLESGLLVQGKLQLPLKCLCSRCLKPFQYLLRIDTYSAHLPLEAQEDEEAVKVVNDCVDLTEQVREDILLEFPQHPLCDQECKGLPSAAVRSPEDKSSEQTKHESSAWAELNKLKF